MPFVTNRHTVMLFEHKEEERRKSLENVADCNVIVTLLGVMWGHRVECTKVGKRI